MTNTELTLDQLQAVSGGAIHPTFLTGPESRALTAAAGSSVSDIKQAGYIRTDVVDHSPPDLKLTTSRLR